MLQEQARRHITNLNDAKLAEYIAAGTEMYQEDALAFARQEFGRRNVTPEDLARLEADATVRVAAQDEAEQKVATRPLDGDERLLAFFAGLSCPTLLGLILVVVLTQRISNRGETRRAAEIWKWFGLGASPWILMILIAFVAVR